MRSITVTLLAAASVVAQDAQPPRTVDIDIELEDFWRDRGVLPAAPAGDAEFLRRVTLDLAGCLPHPHRVRRFLADDSPDKRAREIDRLLASGDFRDYWSFRLSDALLGHPSALRKALGRSRFEAWMRRRLSAGWDATVRDVLTARGAPDEVPAAAFLLSFAPTGHLRTGDVAARVSQTFLGVRLECARCHDHPHDRWTREDFDGFAASFRRTWIAGSDDAREIVVLRGDGTETGASLLGQELAGDGDPRPALADALVRHPLFARAFVNRVWAWLFGRGLVHPFDDLGGTRRAAVPGLLERLSDDFAANGHDVQWLLRTIVSSRAYQRSSAGVDGEEFFARARVRPLHPETLWNAIWQSTELWTAVDSPDFRTTEREDPVRSVRTRFVSSFSAVFAPDSPEALDRHPFTIGIAMAMASRTAPHWAGIPGRIDRLWRESGHPGRVIEELYLATLSRHPRPAEEERCRAHLRGRDTKQALADVLWALCNSDEFLFNH